MADGLSVDEIIQRGRRARELLTDPLYREVMKEAEERFTQEWLDADPERVKDVGLTSWAKVHALAEIEAVLRGLVSNGMMEQAKLEKQKR